MSSKDMYRPHNRSRTPSLIQAVRRNWATATLVAWAVLTLYPAFLFFTGSMSGRAHVRRPVQHPAHTVTTTVVMPSIGSTALAGALPTDLPANSHRLNDATDTFADWKSSPDCQLSSLELHGAFEPLCETKDALMKAMSWGGRIGFDAPYSPRGCDMRWFDTKEICSILSKFSRINIIGDSVMRNMAVALQTYLRQDLLDGGRATWEVHPEGHDCRCRGVFEDRTCAFNSIVSTSMLFEYAPESTICLEEETAAIEYFHVLDYPIESSDLDIYRQFQDSNKPDKPVAYILGHGLWNDLSTEKTFSWIEQVMNATYRASPWTRQPGVLFPRLFMPPNAAGERKPDIFLARQGNVALARFEKAVAQWADAHDMDFLGTFNATIQAHNPDGTHGGMKTNMLKAMMVFNWLNAIDTAAH